MNPYDTTLYDMTPAMILIERIWDGELEGIEDLLSRIDDLDGIEPCFGNTALIAAVRWGHLSVASLLLSRAAGVNAEGFFGKTALHTAVGGSSVPMIELLLRHGADATRSLLHVKTVEVADLLIRHGARTDVRDDEGETVVHSAMCAEQSGALIAFYKKLGLDLDSRAEHGTPMMLALSEGCCRSCVSLIENGVAATFPEGTYDYYARELRQCLEELNRLDLLEGRSATRPRNDSG